MQAREELRALADEQAALRRVATLVARGEPPSAVFATVAEEVGRVVPAADVALVGRYDSEGALEFVGGWSADGDPSFVGSRVQLGGRNVSTLVFERNEPVRVDYSADDASPASALAREWARSSAGAPINVEGRLWGVMIVGSLQPDGLPPGIERDLADFTELVATAIANAQSRAELEASRAESRRAAEEQAALRRVATLVAQGLPAAEIFDAVASETRRILGVEASSLVRLESDGSLPMVAAESTVGLAAAVGDRQLPTEGTAVARVLSTGEPARVDDYEGISGETPERMRSLGFRGSAARRSSSTAASGA